MVKNYLWILVCLAVLIMATFGAFCWLPTSLHYHITERYTFTAGGESTTVYLGSLVPKSGPYQEVKNFQISWPGGWELEPASCVDVVKLSAPLNAGRSLEAVIEYDLSVSQGLVLWKTPVDACNLQAQHMIESDHPAIVMQATQIADGNSWWDIYRLYGFTTDHMSWTGESADCSNEASALDAYRSRKGMCGEYARLMVALCRAAGVPARQISGVVLPGFDLFGLTQTRTGDHPGKAHAWVEFASGSRWSIADPAWADRTWGILQFARNDGRHLYYGGADLEAKVFGDVQRWAAQRGILIGEQFAALKFVTAANSMYVTMTPEVTVRKGWDGRWVITLAILGVTTYLLCRFRRFFLGY